MTRTQRLIFSLGLALALLLAACTAAPAPASTQAGGESAPAGESGALTGKLTVNPGQYFPSESMEWSETNPNPHNMILTLIEEYKGLHPGVEIELVQPPPGDVSSREYIVTNMTAGTIPDIVTTLTRDQVEEIFEANRILGSHYTLNYEIVTSMMFYNKEIFAEVGVEVPETAAEFLVVLQKLKEAGYTPYGGIGSWYMYETLGQFKL
jgi:raffinose/stachyose/melibiose transport system substrate-binding protein